MLVNCERRKRPTPNFRKARTKMLRLLTNMTFLILNQWLSQCELGI
jgi:hypothetical protein